jgi:folate-binding protein YgfZ
MDDGVSVVSALEKAASAALVIPAPERAALVITGEDRRTWLNGLVTCDVVKPKVGEAVYGLFVTPKGRVLTDAMIAIEEDRVLVSVPRAALDELRVVLDKHLVMEDAEVGEAAFEVELVHGPRSGAVLTAARAAGAKGGPLDRTGLGGAVLFVPAQESERVRSARDAALAENGGILGDDAAWEALRIERRVPEMGADFDATTYPQEAGLEKRAVAFDKGCYLGQEVVCMLEMRGHVKRRLVALRVDSPLPPPRGAEVQDASGEAVGQVTSAAIVPTAGGPVALAMVKRARSDEGTELEIRGVKARVLGAAG